MSRQRSTHVNKTPIERTAYQKYIARVEPQPTIDEKKSINFDSSMEPGEELGEPTSKRKRKVSFGVTVSNHFNKHWLQWFFGALFFIGVYFMVDARIEIAVMNNNLANQQKQLETISSDVKSGNTDYQNQFDKIETSIEETKNINHDQDLLINEIKTKLEFIEQILQNLQDSQSQSE